MGTEHPYFIKDADNFINHPTGYTMWNGWGSVAHHSGPMFRYILSRAASLPERNYVVSMCSDDLFPIPEEILEKAKREDAVVIAPVLCSYGPTIQREFLYIPASDQFFMEDMCDIFAPFRVPWEERMPAVVWRGGLSGEMLRIRTVQKCQHIPHTDVKLIDNWPRPEYNKEKTPELFADRIEPEQQCKYKAVMWIDGNCISSNVLWVFATGAVPVIINETYYWFKHMIKPWVHYVPVSADLSDLEDNIRWIFEHDEEAKRIAENAMGFAKNHLSPRAQRAYLDRAIQEHVKKNRAPPAVQDPEVEAVMPLVSFGHMSNSMYVRRRGAKMVESILQYKRAMADYHEARAELEALNHPVLNSVLETSRINILS